MVVPSGSLLRRLRTRAVAVLCAASVAVTSVLPASAQPISLIRDTEVEELLKDYSRPIFRAAGLEAQNIDMRIVQSDSFNAFVMDGRNVFMHTEALMQSDTPNQVIGIIAHETGHIAGAHPATLRTDMKTAQSQQLLLLLLGIGMMVGGAMSGSDAGRELGGVGQGVMMGGENMVIRSFLLKRRSQEAAADQAGLRIPDDHQAVGPRHARDLRAPGAQQPRQLRRSLHAEPSDRGDAYPAAARPGREEAPTPTCATRPRCSCGTTWCAPSCSASHAPTQDTYRQYPASNNSLPARYARAIARNCTSPSFCSGNAMGDIDALMRGAAGFSRIFWELKGQVLLTAGKPREAVAPLRKAARTPEGQGAAGANPAGRCDIQVERGSQVQRRGDPAASSGPSSPRRRTATPIASWPRPTIARRWWRRPIWHARS